MQLEKDVLAKKMLGCIDMINEVLKSNISMREQVKNYAIALDQQITNMMRVQMENEQLRASMSPSRGKHNPYGITPKHDD